MKHWTKRALALLIALLLALPTFALAEEPSDDFTVVGEDGFEVVDGDPDAPQEVGGSLTGDDTGSNDIVGDDTGSNDIVGDDTGSNDIVGDDTGSNDIIGDDTGSGDIVGDDTGSGDIVGDDTGSGDIVGDDTGSGDTVGDDTGSNDNVGDDNGSDDDYIVEMTDNDGEEPIEGAAGDGAGEPAGELDGESLEPAQPVVVLVEVAPETAQVTVRPAATEEDPEPAAIPAREDGAFLLLPGEYDYIAVAEGYVPQEDIPFTVAESEEPMTLTILLTEVAPEDAPEEAPEPVAFDESRTVEGVIVTVRADAGVFPAGAELSVKRVPVYERRMADAAIEELRDEDDNVAVSYTFDIKVINPLTGEEYQPAEGQTVSVSFALSEVADDNLETNVYHVTENEETRELEAEALDVTQEVTEATGETTTATVETEGFSIYQVEFTYKTKQYILPGDSSVALSAILEAVGLTGEVTAVSVSDSGLFMATCEDGVWTVQALRPFSSTEWMKVTIDGVEYEIVVTDDADPVASVTHEGDTTNYASLKAAVDAAVSGDTVTLFASDTGSDSVTINAGVTVEIGAGLSTDLTFTNNGTLTVKKGTKTALTTLNGSVTNNGTLNLEGYTRIGGDLVNNESGGIAFNNQYGVTNTIVGSFTNKAANVKMTSATISGPVTNSGTLTMNAYVTVNNMVTNTGNLTMDYSSAKIVKNDGIALESSGNLTIISCDVTGGSSDGSVRITGGTFTLSGGTLKTKATTGQYGLGLVEGANATITISGGSIYGGDYAFIAQTGNTYYITGGKFYAANAIGNLDNIEPNFPEGKGIVRGGSNYYEVGSPVASINGVMYGSVTGAISAAQDGVDTVVLEADVTSNLPSSATVQFATKKKVTLNLNGHSISHTNGKNALYVRGSSGKIPHLIITGTGTISSTATAILAGTYAKVEIGSDVNVTGNRGIEVGGGQTTLTTAGAITGTECGILVEGAGTSNANKIVNITGGTVSGQYGVYTNQAATVNISGGNITGTDAAVAMDGYKPYTQANAAYTIKLNVTGGTIHGDGAGWAITGRGNEGDGNYEMRLSGGTITADNCAIYHCNEGLLEVSGDVSITGATAIYQKSGIMNISGGTIKGTGAAAAYTYNGNGADPTGDAIVVDNCNYPGGAPVLHITGSTTIQSTNGKHVGDYYGNGQTEADNKSDITSYTNTFTLPPYQKWVSDGDKYVIGNKQLGTIGYEITSVEKTYGDEAFTNELKKTGDGSVAYSSSNEDVAIVDPSSGAVTIKGAGNATIYAKVTDSDNYYYEPSQVSYALTVNKASSNTVTVDIKGWTYGDAPNDPTATATFGEATIGYSPNANGNFMNQIPKTAGKWYVKATVAETKDYAGGEAVKEFEIKRKALTITADSDKKDYDGDALEKNSYTNTDLAQGDKFDSVKVTGSQTEVGKSDNVPSAAKIVNAVGAEVTWSYDITYVNGILEVTQAANAVTVDIKGWTYGDAPNDPTATATFGEATYTYSPNADGNFINQIPKTAGKWYVKATVEGTDNYAGGEAVKEFEIERKTLTITADSDKKDYDGDALEKNSYTNTDLAQGDKFDSVKVTGSQTEVGKGDNVPSAAKIVNAVGAEVTWSYDITYVNGTLEVTQAANAVTVDIMGWTYGDAPNDPTSTATFGEATYTYSPNADGNFMNQIPNTAGKWYVKATVAGTDNYAGGEAVKEFEIAKKALTITADSDTKVYDGDALEKNSYANTALAEGDKIESVTVTGSQTEVGKGDNVPSAAKIVNAVGADVTASYNITYANGALEVTQAANEVTVDIKGWTYGDAPNDPTSTATFGEATYTYSPNADGNFMNQIPNTAGKWYVKATVAGTDNYAGGEAVKEFEIAKKALTITADSDTKVYDGKALEKNSYANTALAEGDKIESVTVTGSQTEVGESDNTASAAKIVNAAGVDVTASYAITYQKGLLKVTQNKALIITADSDTKVYDGKALTKNSYKVAGLADGDKVASVKITGSQTAAGKSDNAASDAKVVNAAGADVTANYEITYAKGTLEVTKAALIITADSDTKVYDGKALTKNSYKVAGLADGDKMESVKITGSQTAAGKSDNAASDAKVVNAAGADVTANYEITYAKGTLEVTKAALTVTAEAKTKTKGEADPALTYKAEGLVDGEVLTGALTRAEGEAAGEYDILQGTLAASDNYSLTYVGAKLTIKAVIQTKPKAEGDVETKVELAPDVPKTKVSGLTKAVAQAVATPEEKARVEQGETLLVYLDVTNIDDTVSESEVAAVTAAAQGLDSDAQIAQYLDLSVYKKVGNDAPQKVSELPQNIKARITIPEDKRREGRVFFIVRVHDGKAEIIARGTGEWIECDTNLFSTYALGYVDPQPEQPVEPEQPKPANPDYTLLAKLKASGSKALKMTWTKVNDAQGYDVFVRDCDGKGDYPLYETVKGGSKTGCKITGLKKGTTYKAYVQAWKKVNGKKTYIGSASPVVHALTGNYDKKECNAKSVQVSETSLTLSAGQTSKVKATVTGVKSGRSLLEHADAVRWYSSDRNVATVDGKGRVTAVGAGRCTVYAVANNGVRASVKVKVAVAPEKVSFKKTSYSVKKGKKLKLAKQLTLSPAGASTGYTWKSSDTKIATVNANGVVKGLKKGTVTITVKTSNGLKAKVKVKVK